MRWFFLSLLLPVLSLAVVVPASWPSAAQNKQLSNFEVQILVEHNNVRQKYSVQLLDWDDSLAALAQEWASKIAADGVKPPAHREGSPYGENFSWGTAGALDAKGVLERWEAESQNYDRTTNTCAAGKFCVHFTQVVWSTTTRVGCGKARSADGQTDFLVCNYSPAGNIVGQSPFPSSGTPTPAPVARQITTAVTPTTGPVQTPTSSTYCPNSPLTRADAAKFILLAKHGRTYTPPAATGTFSDVPLSNPDAPWIEQLAKECNTRGCSSTNDASKQYCPAMPLTREEMAVFVLRSIHGSDYVPPPATGVFADVPKGYPLAPWIEQLAKEGISKGTSRGPSPTYSPKQSVMRGEMALFMLRSIHGGNYTPPPIAGTVVQAAHNPGGLSPQPQLPRGQTEINTQVPGLGQVTMRYCQAYADVSMSDYAWTPWVEQLVKEGISVGCGGPPPTCETPTPASTQNSSTECAEDVRKEVQRLTAEVEQLSKQIRESAKLTTPRPSPGPSAKCPTNKYGIEFMQIPAGSFMMGSTNGPLNERPAHEVTVSPFCLGQYEVTQAQWQAVMGNKPSYFKDCGGNCPVEQVSWNDTQNFINKLNESNDGFRYRLPTEAEWEYACRAGTTEVYAGAYTGEYYGNLDDSGWYEKNSGNKTHAVGGRQPNALGLYDMSGNVWEWCQDWYHDSYNGAPTDGSAWLSGGKQTSRVLRGGSWGSRAIFLRSAVRVWDTPVDTPANVIPLLPRYSRNGFRVVAVR